MKLYYYHYTDSDWNWNTYFHEGYILRTDYGTFTLDEGGYEELVDFDEWIKFKYKRYSLTFDIEEV